MMDRSHHDNLKNICMYFIKRLSIFCIKYKFSSNPLYQDRESVSSGRFSWNKVRHLETQALQQQQQILSLRHTNNNINNNNKNLF